jgi:hypothetical protein
VKVDIHKRRSACSIEAAFSGAVVVGVDPFVPIAVFWWYKYTNNNVTYKELCFGGSSHGFTIEECQFAVSTLCSQVQKSF